MRWLLFFGLLPASVSLSGQSTSCDALPISYDPLGITFGEGEMSFGDSVITIPITNTSTTDMAYPQIKLVPLTPLPPGMTQNTHWDTFASSWNAGLTMPANCFFDVVQPIPPDYNVTFEVWANNLTPLLTDDSCLFDQAFTINMNPAASGVDEIGGVLMPIIGPLPASHRLSVELPAGMPPGELQLLNELGMMVWSTRTVGAGSLSIDVNGFAPGVYILCLRSAGRSVFQERIMIVREAHRE